MSVRHWALCAGVSLVLMGFAGETFKSQATETTIPVKSAVRSTPPDAIAQSMMGPKPTVLRSGSFASGEHPTQGIARIIMQNGKSFLDLDQGFKTSNMGPDLVVILHRSSNVLGSTKPPAYPLKAGDYLILAPLRKFSGAQRYAIPKTANLAEYKSAVIWCRKFNATFGAAPLVR